MADQKKAQDKIREICGMLRTRKLKREIAESKTPIYCIYVQLSASEKVLFAHAIDCTFNGTRNIVMGRTKPGEPKAEIIEDITTGLITKEMLRDE